MGCIIISDHWLLPPLYDYCMSSKGKGTSWPTIVGSGHLACFGQWGQLAWLRPQISRSFWRNLEFPPSFLFFSHCLEKCMSQQEAACSPEQWNQKTYAIRTRSLNHRNQHVKWEQNLSVSSWHCGVLCDCTRTWKGIMLRVPELRIKMLSQKPLFVFQIIRRGKSPHKTDCFFLSVVF